MRKGFTLVELLVAIAIIAILAGLAMSALPGVRHRAESADALAKIRTMGAAVLNYPADHNGRLPSLWPGQVLEYQEGRGGRIVTECADYLGIASEKGNHLVTPLMPRAYARLAEPADKTALRVYVMNTAVTNNGNVIKPFGSMTTAGNPPTGNTTMTALAAAGGLWMMSTADQLQENVAAAPWKNNAPAQPPLRTKRAVFRFDGGCELSEVVLP